MTKWQFLYNCDRHFVKCIKCDAFYISLILVLVSCDFVMCVYLCVIFTLCVSDVCLVSCSTCNKLKNKLLVSSLNYLCIRAKLYITRSDQMFLFATSNFYFLLEIFCVFATVCILWIIFSWIAIWCLISKWTNELRLYVSVCY